MVTLAHPPDAFQAVAEPARREILGLLARGERSVNEVASAMTIRQPLASKQLKVLREAGLVRVRVDGRRRLYALDPAAMRPMRDWMARLERLWAERFDRLEDYLQQLQQQEPTDDAGV